MIRIIEVSLDKNEIEKLKYFSDIQCQGIKCSECPFNTNTYDRLGNAAKKCFAVIADEVLEKGGI